tara:strand:- start:102 stop:845 length:744 start_codon:yes stop_codon:yes gene_type:complete
MSKKRYRVSGRPKVAALNEYIYSNIRADKIKATMVNRPYKPYRLRKAAAMKGVQVKYGKIPPAKSMYTKASKTGAIKASKFLPELRTNTISEITRLSKGGSKNPIPKNPKVGKILRDKYGSVITPQTGVKTPYVPPADYVPPSKLPVERQKIKIGGADPLKGYKPGQFSPINLRKASKALSPAARKAVMQGAKIATKGATRLIPGVGTALLIKDVYDVYNWATSQPKRKKKNTTLYGQKISKSKYTY